MQAKLDHVHVVGRRHATKKKKNMARVALVQLISDHWWQNIHAIIPLQVTGANQGIGLETVRELCKKFDGTVILTGTVLNTSTAFQGYLKHNLSPVSPSFQRVACSELRRPRKAWSVKVCSLHYCSWTWTAQRASEQPGTVSRRNMAVSMSLSIMQPSY